MTRLRADKLTVLIGRECACVNINVRIDLDGGDMEAAGFEDCSHTAGNNTFTNSRYNTTSDQDVLHISGKTWTERKLLISHMTSRASSVYVMRKSDARQQPFKNLVILLYLCLF